MQSLDDAVVVVVGASSGIGLATARAFARRGCRLALAARIPHTFATAYSASKFGVAGFPDALRQEVLARSRVQVCGVYPAVVDTPIPWHAANYTGRALRPLPPVLDPAEVAEAIVRLVQAPRRAVHLGALHAAAPVYALMPELAGRVMALLANWLLFHTGPRQAETAGAVLHPVPQGTQARILWGRQGGHHPVALAIGAAAGLALLAAATRRRAG